MVKGVRQIIGHLPGWIQDWFFERGRLPSFLMGLFILGSCSLLGMLVFAVPPAVPFWTAWALGQIPQLNSIRRAWKIGDWSRWYSPQAHQPRIPLPSADPDKPERLLDHAEDWSRFWQGLAQRHRTVKLIDRVVFGLSPIPAKALWMTARMCDFNITSRRLAWRRLVSEHSSVRWFDRWIFERDRRPGSILGWAIFAATMGSKLAGVPLPALGAWFAMQILGEVPFAVQLSRMLIWHQVRLFNRPGATLRRTSVPSRRLPDRGVDFSAPPERTLPGRQQSPRQRSLARTAPGSRAQSRTPGREIEL